MELAQWSEQQISIAEFYRNLSESNPVTLRISSGAQQFDVVVSYVEPGYGSIAANVIWVCVADDYYGKVFRRTSSSQTHPFLYTWQQLTEYSQLFEQPPVWSVQQVQKGELFRYGPKLANEKEPGIFRLSSWGQPIPDTHVALRNKRIPLPHAHAPVPTTKINVGGLVIDISDTDLPEAGDVLLIVNANGQLKGEWRKLSTADIFYTGLWPVRFYLGLPNGPIDELTQVQLRAYIEMEDGSTVEVKPKWTVANPTYGTVNEDGVFTSRGVLGDRTVRVTANFIHPETDTPWSASGDISIRDVDAALVMTGIIIEGPSEVNKNGTANYIVYAQFSNGTRSPVLPDFFLSSTPSVATISQNGTLRAANVIGADAIRLTASYTHKGVSKLATFDVNIIDNTVYPESATIVGPDSVKENSAATYVLEVVFTDGKKQQVAVRNWAHSNQSVGRIDPILGKLVTSGLDGNTETTITASVTIEGLTIGAEKTVFVLDTTVYPHSVEIVGPSEIVEGRTGSFSARIHFTDGTSAIKNVIWAQTNPTAGTLGATGYYVATKDVQGDTETNLTATYFENGKTVVGEKRVTVKDTDNIPALARIIGNTSMFSGETQLLELEITFKDGSTARMLGDWTVSNTNVASISDSGVLQAKPVIELAVINVEGSYEASGVRVSANFTVTINSADTRPVSASIIGPSSVVLGNSQPYFMEVLFSNGSKKTVNAQWQTADTNAGTIYQSGVFIPSNRGNTMLTAVYNANGRSVNATKEITVV